MIPDEKSKMIIELMMACWLDVKRIQEMSIDAK
jgi:hypothetical protein